ncbi:MAG: hypothetical protein DMF78_12770 [Acidobacteria bacterium]|nr:MAG: hypothetical protein DMF78_12770 [Acidobacteriota bacterium]
MNCVMKTMSATTHLTDAELVHVLGRLAHGERQATVTLIAHLAEFDARRLYAAAGFGSTFKYCVKVLRLSEDAAVNRIEAARAARRFPAVLDMLVSGALSPTTARMLARHLTAENHDAVLAAASGKTKEEVEERLARLFPQRDVRSSVRLLRPANAPVFEVRAEADAARASGPAPAPASAPALAAPPTLSSRPVVRPLAPERYEIRFTASAATREKLRLAQDLLGHAVPSGDLDHNVPAEVRRVVAARDGGRCAFVAPSGQRCGERRFLEFHHIQPYGAGGRPTTENIQLRCGAHNRYEAEVFYGPGREYGGVLWEPSTNRRPGSSAKRSAGHPFRNG